MLSSPDSTEKSGPQAAMTWLIWSSEPDASFTPDDVPAVAGEAGHACRSRR